MHASKWQPFVLCLFLSSLAHARKLIPPVMSGCEAIAERYTFSGCLSSIYFDPNCLCNSAPWLGTMALCVYDHTTTPSDDPDAARVDAWTHIGGWCRDPTMLSSTMSFSDVYANATRFVPPTSAMTAKPSLNVPIRLPRDKVKMAMRTVGEFNRQLGLGHVYGYYTCAIFFAFIALGCLNNLFQHCTRTRIKTMVAPKWLKTLQRVLLQPSLLPNGVHMSHASIFGLLITYPTRLESLWIVAFCTANIVLLFPSYDLFLENIYWPNNTMLQFSRYMADRAGEMSFSQLPMLYLFGGRNNLLLWMTGWSFERFIVLHKWTSRMMMFQAIVHSVAYTWHTVASDGWRVVWFYMVNDAYWMWGVLATTIGSVILVASVPNLRRGCYLLFLKLHVVFALLFTIGCWYHVRLLNDDENMLFMYASVGIWAADRVLRILFTILPGKINFTADAAIIKGTDCMRLLVDVSPTTYGAIDLSRRRPGAYVYLCVPSLGWHHANPFTVAAWHNLNDDLVHDMTTPFNKHRQGSHYGALDTPSTPISIEKRKNHEKHQITQMELLIRPQRAATRALFDDLRANGGTAMYTVQLHGGAHGHTQPILNHDVSVLVAGGIGCASTLAYLQEAVQWAKHNAKQQKRKKQHQIVFLWVIQTIEQLAWAQSTIDDCIDTVHSLSAMPVADPDAAECRAPRRVPELDIQIHVTRASLPSSSRSSTSSNTETPRPYTIHYGVRPNLDKILKGYVDTADTHARSIGIFQCGPSAMSDHVRAIAARHSVPYYEEAFDW
ncbi:ferric reductase like transmembrane component-domain-containing protein [Gongronella butleri]|nr:ferric reductase like transmembrane component-domain-containing protein [Gongronella butleri]